MYLDDLGEDIDSLKEHRHALGRCMDCGDKLKQNRYRCPTCLRRIKDYEEAAVLVSTSKLRSIDE